MAAEPVHCARVAGLQVRPSRKGDPERVAAVRALAGFGLDGDCHAAARSPRQVLIASSHAYRAWQLAPMALRENLLLDGDLAALAPGDRLRVGDGAEMVVMFACEPCGKLERARPGLASAIGRDRGLLARVTRSGTVRQGDAVRWRPAQPRSPSPLFSDHWRERVQGVLRQVPPGQWVSYARLAELAGVSPGYCRAFPRWLATLGEGTRAGTADEECRRGPPWDGDGLYDGLACVEGDGAWN